jgi:hypothetical protein
MKVATTYDEQHEFVKTTFEITVETPTELVALWASLNTSPANARAQIALYMTKAKALSEPQLFVDASYNAWAAVDAAMKKFNLKD